MAACILIGLWFRRDNDVTGYLKKIERQNDVTLSIQVEKEEATPRTESFGREDIYFRRYLNDSVPNTYVLQRRKEDGNMITNNP